MKFFAIFLVFVMTFGGVMVADHISRVLTDEGGEFAHGYTYSGHPVCAAVACANLKILRDEGIIENVDQDTGPYLQQRWRELEEHPLVGQARGLGFLGALELVKDKTSRAGFDEPGKVGLLCREACFNNGLIMRVHPYNLSLSICLPVSVSLHAFESAQKYLGCKDTDSHTHLTLAAN